MQKKGFINGNDKNEPDSSRGISSPKSSFDSLSSKSRDEDEDENEKSGLQLYQDGIEGIKGYKLFDEIKSKHEKYQIYLENNL